jgi:cyclic beta-1,2-glucan synthetase
MYRAGLEAILGFAKQGDTLTITPRVPSGWSDYSIEYHHASTLYRIMVEQPSGVARAGPELLLDGRPLAGAALPPVDDGGTHDVVVRPRR